MGGIDIHIENGKIVVENGADPRIVAMVKKQNRKAVGSRARRRLSQRTREFVGEQIGPIMEIDRRDTTEYVAMDSLPHQAIGGKAEEVESNEAMADTDRYDIENGIA